MHGKISNGGLPQEETSFDSKDAPGHVGAARRGLILLPGFFIVDTDRLIPEPNNYAALDRLDLGGETTGVMPLASSPSLRRGRMLRVMRDPIVSRTIMQIIRTLERRNTCVSPENTKMFTKESLRR